MASEATDQLCVCKHCHDVYQDPRILSCLHSYCLQCIYKIHVQGATSITCPSCYHPTPLPQEGVASLPPNIRLMEEAEQNKLIQRLISLPPPICESCDDSTASVAYCRDCDDLLCQECWDIHKKVKGLRSHFTYAIDDLKKKSQGDLLKILPSSTSSVPLCPDHDDQKLGFYCTQCAVPVCVGCTISRHKGHPVKEVNEQINQNKTDILEEVATLPEKKKQLENVIKTIDDEKKKLKAVKSKGDGIINGAFTKLRHLINQREQELLTKYMELATTKETHLSIQKESFRHLLESMSHCHSLASIATSQHTDVQLLSIAQILQDRTDTLQQLFTDASLDLCETPDLVVEVNIDALVKMITEFGSVADPSPCGSNTTAVVPRQRLGIGAEMKVKVTTRNSSGNELNKGGSVAGGILFSNGQKRVDCPVSDNGDGTYLVSVIPQQLGQHQLFITVNNQGIQSSPFKLNVVAQRDYTKLKHPVQTITGIDKPRYIAFTDNGDMYATSDGDHCINVYDSSGKKKTTIGSEGSGELQFQSPRGIDISGEVVYVAEWVGDRIHKLTTGGEYIGVFGRSGHGIGNFYGATDLKISPDGKVYVADPENGRIQVFHPDWTISHVIDATVSCDGSFCRPDGIAFDLSGNVHVSEYSYSSVTVFTPSGQFVRQYGKTHTNGPTGIAIDPSGYSLVNTYENGMLSIFDPSGRFIHSVGGFIGQYGVSVSPDGSVWVADKGNNRLVKY